MALFIQQSPLKKILPKSCLSCCSDSVTRTRGNGHPERCRQPGRVTEVVSRLNPVGTSASEDTERWPVRKQGGCALKEAKERLCQ